MMRKPYNEEACIEIYRELKKDPRNPQKVELALELTLPILNFILSKYFYRYQPGMEAYDEAVSYTVIKLYSYLMSDRFYDKYYDDPRTHFSLLFTICKSEVITALKKVRKYEIFNQTGIVFPHIYSMNYEYGRSAIEHKIYLSELPEDILNKVIKKIRFIDEDFELCKLIATKLVNGEGVPVHLIRKKWGTRNLKFFTQYIRILIRSVLYDLKPDIEKFEFLSEIDKFSILSFEQDFFTEGWHAGGASEADWWFGCDSIDEEPEDK